jgi:hypothetical protein
VTFDRPVAPRFTDGAFDRAQILSEFSHEPLEGLNVDQPLTLRTNDPMFIDVSTG